MDAVVAQLLRGGVDQRADRLGAGRPQPAARHGAAGAAAGDLDHRAAAALPRSARALSERNTKPCSATAPPHPRQSSIVASAIGPPPKPPLPPLGGRAALTALTSRSRPPSSARARRDRLAQRLPGRRRRPPGRARRGRARVSSVSALRATAAPGQPELRSGRGSRRRGCGRRGRAPRASWNRTRFSRRRRGVERAEQPARAARHAGQLDQVVGQRRAARRRSSCSDAIGRQCSSTSRAGSPADVVALEVLGPQPQAGVAGERRVAGDDVDLGVVEQRVLVEVGGADREPRVVDDADLGVHVERAGALAGARAGSSRRGSACAPSSAATSRPSIPRVSSWPLLALCGSRTTIAEVVARRVAQLVLEDVRRSPATTGTGSRGRSGAARCAARARRSRGSRTRRAGARRRRPRARCGRAGPSCRRPARAASGSASASPATASQRSAKWAATSRDDRPAQQRATRRASRSRPPCAGARWSRSGRRPARSGRCRRRTRPRRRRSRSSRGGSASSGRAASSSHWIFVPRTSCVALGLDARPRRGWKTGTGAPAHTSTRTGTRSATSASSSRTGRRRRAGRGRSPAPGATSRRARGAARRGSPRPSRGSALRAVDQHLERVALARRRRAVSRPQALAWPGASACELPVPAQAAQVVVDHRALDRRRRRAASKRSRSRGCHAATPYPLASARPWPSRPQPTPQRLAAIREQMSLLSDYL